MDRIVWTDITKQLDDVASSLGVGRFLTPPDFILHEAMSALEMMAPKMDSGVDISDARSARERVKAGTLQCKFTSSEVIYIMDTILQLETLWMDGFSLAQSLLTCLYLQDIDVVDDEVLKAYLAAELKLIDNLRNVVLKADIFEEEDFTPAHFGFSLLPEVDISEASSKLAKVEADFEASLKRIKNTLKQGPNEELQKEKEIMDALLARIRFKKSFINGHVALDKPACKGVEQAKKSLNSALNQLSAVVTTSHLGTVVPNACDAHSALRFLSPAPPRVVSLPSVEQAVETVREYLGEIQVACGVLEVKTLMEMFRFVSVFGEAKRNILSRCRLLLLCVGGRKIHGEIALTEYVAASMVTDFCVEETLVEHATSSKFFLKFYKPVIDTISMLCSNHTRRRRRIEVILDSWGNLQAETEHIDVMLRDHPGENKFERYMNSFIFGQVTESMVTYIFSAVETELLRPDELASAYWYADYVLGLQVINEVAVLTFKEDTAAGQKKKKKLSRPEPQRGPPASAHTILKEIYQCFCRAMCRFMFGLIRQRRWERPVFAFGSELARFESRFCAFYSVSQPRQFSFADYQKHTLFESSKPIDFYKHCIDTLKSAQISIDRFVQLPNKPHWAEHLIPKVTALQKVASMNIITMNLCARDAEIRAQYDASKPPSFDFSLSPLFPVIRVPL